MVSAAWWRKADDTAATLSLTDNEVELTAWGGLLQRVLRLTGPVLPAGPPVRSVSVAADPGIGRGYPIPPCAVVPGTASARH